MADEDDWEPAHIPPRGTQWKDAWTPIEPGEEYVPPEPRPESLPDDPEPRTLRSQPLVAAVFAVVGLLLVANWIALFWEASNTTGEGLTYFAWSFFWSGVFTCVYLFFLWRWLFGRER